MENTNRNNEDVFAEFFRGLDEKYQQYLIDELKKPPDTGRNTEKADSAGLAGDPKSR